MDRARPQSAKPQASKARVTAGRSRRLTSSGIAVVISADLLSLAHLEAESTPRRVDISVGEAGFAYNPSPLKVLFRDLQSLLVVAWNGRGLRIDNLATVPADRFLS